MNRIYEILISLVVVVVLFAVVALFLPSKRSVEYKIESNRPISTVFDVMNGFNRFDEWNVLRSDRLLKSEVSDPATGVGATLRYTSLTRSTGDGKWELVESEPEKKIKFKIDDNSQGSNKTLTVLFDRTGPMNKNVEIRQIYEVDYGWNLLGRYAGMYVERNVGDKIKAGSKRLNTFLATIPKLSYADREQPITFVDVPAANALVATVISKRDNNEIATGIINKMAWINKIMAANGLTASGPMRIVTNEFTTDSYSFDVVQTVKKGDESTGEWTVKIEPQSEVVFEQFPAGRAATTDYTGYATGLEGERQAVRAWALVNGASTRDRAYEEYLVPVQQMMTENAKFKVYWPVK
jgi:effector-binding domain-containing protein